MTLKNVKSSLPRISKSLKATNASREFLIKNTRDVIILCSHSIIAAHKGDLRLAKQKIKKAEVVLKRNRKKAKDILLTGAPTTSSWEEEESRQNKYESKLKRSIVRQKVAQFL